jgi:hypothetical protein
MKINNKTVLLLLGRKCEENLFSQKHYLQLQSFVTKMPATATITGLALGSLGNATWLENNPICVAMAKEPKVSAATVAVAGIFMRQTLPM